jgi:hypothetical protein
MLALSYADRSADRGGIRSGDVHDGREAVRPATNALAQRDEARTRVTLSLSRLPPPLTPLDDLGGRSFFPPAGFAPRTSVMLSLSRLPPPFTLAVGFGARSFVLLGWHFDPHNLWVATMRSSRSNMPAAPPRSHGRTLGIRWL